MIRVDRQHRVESLKSFRHAICLESEHDDHRCEPGLEGAARRAVHDRLSIDLDQELVGAEPG